MSAASSTGARTSAPNIASARRRSSRASNAAAARTATTTTPALGRGPVSAARANTRAESRAALILYAAAMFRWCAAAIVTLVALAACGNSVQRPGGRGRVNDPRTQAGRLGCLLSHHLPVADTGATGLQIGPLPAGPTIRFMPSPGGAEESQIEGRAQGAEVIGSALLYPNGAPDSELKVIEGCMAQGVKG